MHKKPFSIYTNPLWRVLSCLLACGPFISNSILIQESTNSNVLTVQSIISLQTTFRMMIPCTDVGESKHKIFEHCRKNSNYKNQACCEIYKSMFNSSKAKTHFDSFLPFPPVFWTDMVGRQCQLISSIIETNHEQNIQTGCWYIFSLLYTGSLTFYSFRRINHSEKFIWFPIEEIWWI